MCWFPQTVVRRVLFSRVTKQSRKGISPFSSISLVNWMLVFCSFKCSFYYKIDVFKIFSKAHNESLPELLSNNIYTERRNGYSLRGGDCLSVPRFETRFMKDSLAYRGTVLWNTICLNENGISHLSNKDRNLIRTKDYFKNFKFDTTSASTTRNINADFMYN